MAVRMTNCENCNLHVQHQEDEQSLCTPCKELAQGKPQIRLSPIARENLELILAWRSHPEIYGYFRNQTGPLNWAEHCSWFESRDPTQQDFLIHYGGRRVGVVGVNTSDEITIYIGDFSARRKGIAKAAINWLKERFEDRTPLLAEVSEENKSSKRLFQVCGFHEKTRSDGWITFVYNS